MKVLVCGGRDQTDLDFVERTLDRLHLSHGPFDRLMHGDARGVDRMAGKWARSRGILVWGFLPEWHRADAADGLKRNQHMISSGSPDLVIAFPGGAGTASMVDRAKAARIEVIAVDAPVRSAK